MKRYAFGVDVGGTTVKLGLFTTDGTLLEDWEIPTRTEDAGSGILPDISASVSDRIREKGIPKEEIEGIGLGLPGPVLPDGTIQKAVNLGWDVFNVHAVRKADFSLACLGNRAGMYGAVKLLAE